MTGRKRAIKAQMDGFRGGPKPVDMKPARVTAITDEEDAFIQAKLQDGLTPAEVHRMFFRSFQRDISVTAVWHRKRRSPYPIELVESHTMPDGSVQQEIADVEWVDARTA